MITAEPRPPADLPAVVWRMYVSADKSPVQALRACAAWIAAPHPVQAIRGAS